MKYSLCCALLLIMAPEWAYATRNVSSPGVIEGKWTAAARYGLEQDDNAAIDQRLQQVYLVDYGINSWWATRLVIRYSKRDGRANDHTGIEWEQRFQLFKKASDGFEGAVRVGYYRADNTGAADALDWSWLGRFDALGWRHTHNLIIVQEIGGHRSGGVSGQASWQSFYKVNETVGLGMEWYGDVGRLNRQHGINRQGHQLGAVMELALNEHVSIHTGYLAGITKPAADGLAKFFLSGKF